MNSPLPRYFLFAAVLVVATAGLASAQAPDHIIAPHDLHLENEIECTTCHDGIETATDGLTAHRPDMDVCADCHEVEDEDNCATCHTDVETAGEGTPPLPGARRFPHADHLGAGLACADCHGDLTAAPPVIPSMTRCRECHDTADDFDDCRVCHTADEDLLPRDHRGLWLNRHGLAARIDQDRCRQCHGPSGCLECHAGDNVMPRVHDLGFATSHALAARGHEMECGTCHQDQQSCVACHRAQHVMPKNHSRSDWLLPNDGGAHASEGLFDIESCIACHDEGAAAPSCARCHGG